MSEVSRNTAAMILLGRLRGTKAPAAARVSSLPSAIGTTVGRLTLVELVLLVSIIVLVSLIIIG